MKHDAYLFSKCYDARAFILGRLLRANKKLVGVDLFDDYFSQTGRSQFVCLRDWLRTMSNLVDFHLSSTERMRGVAATYMPSIPGHVMNDPFSGLDREQVAASVERNLMETVSTGVLQVGWFGIGDNRHFPVGLQDLCAFGSILSELARGGLVVELSILTNRRALNADALAMLARLPVPWHLDEWTEDKERDLLAHTLVSFIPVNAQNFSVAKSLNRAASALTGGAQVLSTGFPLYASLGDFIYRRPQDLLDDISNRSLRLRGQTIPALEACLATTGDPRAEARNLSLFMHPLHSSVKSRPVDADRKLTHLQR